jgi:hypothetical protein
VRIYRLGNWSWGFSEISRVKSVQRVSFYITHYMTADFVEDMENKHRYYYSKDIDLVKAEYASMSKAMFEEMLMEYGKNEWITYMQTISMGEKQKASYIEIVEWAVVPIDLYDLMVFRE